MNPGILTHVVLRVISMILFTACGTAIGIAAAEIDSRFIRSRGMEALGWWVIPMMLFWLISVICAVILFLSDHSLFDRMVTIVASVIGTGLGSAALFLAGPLWASWRMKNEGRFPE
ncbi:hypothetical protein JW906_15265 [bacterium]|nr:hypothetical protein [bacterium]